MPGLDRRGPFGNGPKTGRGLGKCSENSGFSRCERDRQHYGKRDSKMHRGRHRTKTDREENQIMRISIPLINNEVSDHFGGADSFFVAEIGDNGEIIREFTQTPPEHAPGVYPKWLKSENVDILLTKSIGGRARAFLNDYGIKVITGINNGEPAKIVSEYIKGNVSSSNEFCAGSGNCSEH